MRLDSSFDVTAPIDQVWAALMDFERVAACLPGAQVLNVLSEDAYQVGMKVKLGPVTMQYKGQLEVVERKPEAHQATLKGKAKEARGQGTAEATAQLALTENGPVTHGTVSADVALSGRAAAMGQSVINTVTEQMMAQFATNLQALLSGPEQPSGLEPAAEDPLSATKNANGAARKRTAAKAVPPAPSTPVADVPVEPAAVATDSAAVATTRTAVPVDHSAPGVGSASAPRPAGSFQPPAGEPDNALDALALARAVAEAQLREPKKALGLLAIVAFLAYLLGRRAGSRD